MLRIQRSQKLILSMGIGMKCRRLVLPIFRLCFILCTKVMNLINYLINMLSQMTLNTACRTGLVVHYDLKEFLSINI